MIKSDADLVWEAISEIKARLKQHADGKREMTPGELSLLRSKLERINPKHPFLERCKTLPEVRR
jgi:hypothetical protein